MLIVSNVFSTANLIYAHFFLKIQKDKRDTSRNTSILVWIPENVNCHIAQKCDIGDSSIEVLRGNGRVNK